MSKLKSFILDYASVFNEKRGKILNYTEAKLGRIFILRLHHDERLHEVIEKFAAQKQVSSALCFFLGGAEDKSKVVVGPKDGKALPPEPMVTLLRGVHESLRCRNHLHR